MTWLFSLYWLGALAVAGPIIFHMWRRTPRGERPYSTLMFLTSSPPRATSRSRIEHWVLFLLRAAALAMLAWAFTRPLWRMPLIDPNDESNEQLVAVLLDTSASMRRERLWDDMIQNLDQRISKLPLQTTVALYKFDHVFTPVADFAELKSMDLTARRDTVRSRLKALKPTWEDTRLGEGLVRTATAMQEAQTERSKYTRQRIWLASDLQAGSESVALQGYDWPDDIPVEIIFAQPVSPSNAGLQVVDTNVESADQVVRVRVTNAADSLKEQFSLKWDHVQSPDIPVYVPPGQSRILTPPKLPDGVIASCLVLTGDDHEFDNRVYFAESAPESQIVIYAGPESSNDPEGARFYLDRVFSASPRFEVELKDWQDTKTISSGSKPSLIVLVQADPEMQPLIDDHLANAGTVVIASPTVEAMTSSLKICGRDKLTVTEATVAKYAMLGDIDFDHPLFAPFVESQFSDFTGIRFWKHRTIGGLNNSKSISKTDAEPANNTVDRILARFDDGDPAIVAFPMRGGRVIVFAAGWQPADSQFARSSKFPMLMFRLLENSTGASPRPGSETIGSSLAWPTSTGGESPQSGLVKTSDGREFSSQQLDQPFTHTEVPGIYTLTVPGRSEQVAVNLAADESRTTPLTLEQLESYGLKLNARERPVEQQRQRERKRQLQLAEIEQSQKLWRSILVAVIALLIVETYLSGRFVGAANQSAGS